MDICEAFRLFIGYPCIFLLEGDHFHALPTFVIQQRTLVEGGTGSLGLPAPQGFNNHLILYRPPGGGLLDLLGSHVTTTIMPFLQCVGLWGQALTT